MTIKAISLTAGCSWRISHELELKPQSGVGAQPGVSTPGATVKRSAGRVANVKPHGLRCA